MAGGLFGDAFKINPKCVIFVILLMIAYKMLPEKDINIYKYYVPMISIGVVGSYYYLYNCKNTNYVTLLMVVALSVLLLQYLYWNLPRNLWIAYYFIFFLGYIALAYFDHVFICEVPLQSAKLSFTHLFKNVGN